MESSQDDEQFRLPPLSGSVVCAFGELVLDLVAVLGGPMPLGGQVRGTVETRPGGSARNVAVAVAAEKVPARFIGRCGDGPAFKALSESLSRAGVETRAMSAGRYSTSLCVQLISGETTYITDDSDADQLGVLGIEESWFENAAVVHTTGADIYRPSRLPVFERVAELARRHSCELTIDTALVNELDAFGIDRFRLLVKELRPAVVFCSEQEGDLLQVDRAYLDGAAVVVQHRSVAPTKVFLPEGQRFSVPVEDTHRYADSVGAGDAFAGGFLGAWMKGCSVRQAVEVGHHSALHLLRGLMHPAGRR